MGDVVQRSPRSLPRGAEGRKGRALTSAVTQRGCEASSALTSELPCAPRRERERRERRAPGGGGVSGTVGGAARALPSRERSLGGVAARDVVGVWPWAGQGRV